MQHFLGNGNKVTILAPHDEYSTKLMALGCHVIDIPISSQGINPYSDAILFFRYIRYYQLLSPDLIINYTIKPNIYGSLAAGLVSVPSIAVTTGLGYTFINNGFVATCARALYKLSLRFASQVWFLNADDKKTFISHRLVDEKRTYVLNGEGVDVSFFSPRENLGGNETVRFLLIARMLWDKGVGEYVAAAKIIKTKYPNAVFQLLGASGAENPSAIAEEILVEWQRLGLVEYLGSKSDVRPLISSSHCVVLPSYREGVPRTLMEASAMARPVIATNVPGCSDVVEDGVTGYLCLPRDVDDLASKMELFIMANDAERARMGVYGREKAMKDFDENIVINKYADRIGPILGTQKTFLVV